MFNFYGFLKSLGIVMFIFITFSFLFGLTGINNIPITLTILYTISYVLNGFLAPIWNPDTPYTASYLSSITLTLLNLLFAYFILDILVFTEPASINSGMVRNSLVSLIATFIAIKILNKKQELAR